MSKPLPYPVLRIVPKRGDNDCAIAALASYLGHDYERVLIAASKVNRRVLEEGLTAKDIAATATKLKIKGSWSTFHDHYDANDRGLLWVTYNDRPLEHVVMFVEGFIYDPDHDPVSLWDAEDYFAHYNAVGVSLFSKVEQ